MSRFAIIPTMALSDDRLSPRDITVLCVFGTYADKSGRCYPSLSNIAAQLGVSRQAIQKSLRTLCACGYVSKSARKTKTGGQTSNFYHIKMDYVPPSEHTRSTLQPEVAPPQPQVAPPATSEVAPPATSEVAPITLNDPVERPKGNKIYKPDCVDQQIWDDFLLLRKSKRSPLTNTALNGIKKQADIAGMGLNDVLEMCCMRGWMSFKAEWVEGKKGTKNSKYETPADEWLADQMDRGLV